MAILTHAGFRHGDAHRLHGERQHQLATAAAAWRTTARQPSPTAPSPATSARRRLRRDHTRTATAVDADGLHHRRQLRRRHLRSIRQRPRAHRLLGGQQLGWYRRVSVVRREYDDHRLHDQRQHRGCYGGGLAVGGTATITGCTISGNSGAIYGGGVMSRLFARRRSPTARSAATPTRISNFQSGTRRRDVSSWCRGDAHRLHDQRQLRPERHGGGVGINGLATLTNCTISGNSAAAGGGVFNYGTASLVACTVSGNSATAGRRHRQLQQPVLHLQDDADRHDRRRQYDRKRRRRQRHRRHRPRRRHGLATT